MDDLTLLYYTDNAIGNNIPGSCIAENVRNHLLKITENKIPIVSVSQRPIDFGTNICVGEIGRSRYNLYKQIYIGAQTIKTKYVACCEDDSLYNMEHFEYRPKNEKAFSYNMNRWFTEKKRFWNDDRPGTCFMIANTEELVRVLKNRFDKTPDKPPVWQEKRWWGEIGPVDRKFGIKGVPVEYFKTKLPVLVFNFHDTLSGKRRFHPEWQLVSYDLNSWGKSYEIWNKFWFKKI